MGSTVCKTVAFNREGANSLPHHRMDSHDQDYEFLQNLRSMSSRELHVFRMFQACEPWRRVAIEREMQRRTEKDKEVET